MSKCIVTDPSSFEEAVQEPTWVDTMVEEIFPRPVGKSVVGSRWIYKVKKVVDGSVEKYKARIVA